MACHGETSGHGWLLASVIWKTVSYVRFSVVPYVQLLFQGEKDMSNMCTITSPPRPEHSNKTTNKIMATLLGRDLKFQAQNTHACVKEVVRACIASQRYCETNLHMSRPCVSTVFRLHTGSRTTSYQQTRMHVFDCLPLSTTKVKWQKVRMLSRSIGLTLMLCRFLVL